MYSKPFEGDFAVVGNRGWYYAFGKKAWHGGIDFACPVGTPIYAIEDGVVVWSQWDKFGGGNMILIRADSDGGQTLFLHLDQRMVNVGDRVKRAQQIATSGATGVVEGAHLHFEFWKDKDPASAGITATDEMANNQQPAKWPDSWKNPSYFNQNQDQIMYEKVVKDAENYLSKAGQKVTEYPNTSFVERIDSLNGVIQQLEAQNVKKDQWIGERDKWIGGRDQIIADLRKQLETATPENVAQVKEEMLKLINQL